jgi:hypothetical protein
MALVDGKKATVTLRNVLFAAPILGHFLGFLLMLQAAKTALTKTDSWGNVWLAVGGYAGFWVVGIVAAIAFWPLYFVAVFFYADFWVKAMFKRGILEENYSKEGRSYP